MTSEEHCTLMLELANSAEAQWRSFDAKLRNQVRKGRRSGFEPRWGAAGLAAFYRVLLENMRDLGTPVRGERYFAGVLEHLDRAELLVLERGGRAAGAMLYVEHRDTACDPWASSLRRLLPECPNQVLYWEAIRRAIALGLTRFDMGRSQWESGTFRFKAQWGAEPLPLHYQYLRGAARELPTLEDQKRGYGLAVALWKRLPLWAADPLGERAKRMFPEVV